ncbi:hypothetical protein C8R45DRAFT_1110975 [Mycena sanguinolenta]|nr:hypothetical protein C8R45DRAFT_1110975 [Mycena sanguinolenta]
MKLFSAIFAALIIAAAAPASADTVHCYNSGFFTSRGNLIDIVDGSWCPFINGKVLNNGQTISVSDVSQPVHFSLFAAHKYYSFECEDSAGVSTKVNNAKGVRIAHQYNGGTVRASDKIRRLSCTPLRRHRVESNTSAAPMLPRVIENEACEALHKVYETTERLEHGHRAQANPGVEGQGKAELKVLRARGCHGQRLHEQFAQDAGGVRVDLDEERIWLGAPYPGFCDIANLSKLIRSADCVTLDRHSAGVASATSRH